MSWLSSLYDHEPQWLKTVQTLGIDTGHPKIDQARTAAAGAAVLPIAAAGGAAGAAGTAASTAAPAATGGAIGAVNNSLPGLSSLAPKVLDWLTGNGGRNALGAAGVLNAAMLQNQANQYAKGALGTAQSAYDAKAPLRTAGIAGMQAAPTTLPGLSTISARGNPFAR